VRQVQELRGWAEITSLKGTVRDNDYFGFDILQSTTKDGGIQDGIRVTSTDPADEYEAVNIMKVRNGHWVGTVTLTGHSVFDIGAEAIQNFRKH
jgi:hypothetical protein